MDVDQTSRWPLTRPTSIQRRPAPGFAARVADTASSGGA